jgi:hypothetical protein
MNEEREMGRGKATSDVWFWVVGAMALPEMLYLKART